MLWWRMNRANKMAGDVAGNIGPNGYRTVMVDYRQYYAHHLAIFLSTGEFPAKGSHIDHINRDPADNRLVNLRVTTPSVNGLNRRGPNKNNATGVRGVHQKPSGRFVAHVHTNGRKQHLGTFASIREAEEAVRRALLDRQSGESPAL